MDFASYNWQMPDTAGGAVGGSPGNPLSQAGATLPLVDSPMQDPDQSAGPKGKGGRPRDVVWSYFDGDSQKVTCNFCQWTMDKPKAFRLRQHILACPNVAEEDRTKIRLTQEAKDKANATKLANKHQTSLTDEDLGESTSLAPTDPGKKRKLETKEQTPAAKPPLRSPITCHVLDSMSGRPAAGINCRLDRLTTTGFVLLSNGHTNEDGRCNQLLAPSEHIDPGLYKVTFFVQDYFTQRSVSSFYPFVEITFEIRQADAHYHIPLLLSPFSFTTYRGS